MLRLSNIRPLKWCRNICLSQELLLDPRIIRVTSSSYVLTAEEVPLTRIDPVTGVLFLQMLSSLCQVSRWKKEEKFSPSWLPTLFPSVTCTPRLEVKDLCLQVHLSPDLNSLSLPSTPFEAVTTTTILMVIALIKPTTVLISFTCLEINHLQDKGRGLLHPISCSLMTRFLFNLSQRTNKPSQGILTPMPHTLINLAHAQSRWPNCVLCPKKSWKSVLKWGQPLGLKCWSRNFLVFLLMIRLNVWTTLGMESRTLLCWMREIFIGQADPST